MAVAITLHTLAAVIWVGGMFFAYMVLRPATGVLEPPTRLALWVRVFKQFFSWVWLAIIVLLATGYWMVFSVFGGFAGSGLHIHLMQGVGILMMLLFLHLYFAPYRRLKNAVTGEDWSYAGKQLNQIRLIVGTNLLLGLSVIIIAVGGRYL